MTPAERVRVQDLARDLAALGVHAPARVLLAGLRGPEHELPDHVATVVLALRYLDTTHEGCAGRVSLLAQDLGYLARRAMP